MAEFTPFTETVLAAYEASNPRKGEWVDEGKAEFKRWLDGLLTDAYFQGAQSMADQVEEDHNISTRPQFVSPYNETEYEEWEAKHGK